MIIPFNECDQVFVLPENFVHGGSESQVPFSLMRLELSVVFMLPANCKSIGAIVNGNMGISFGVNRIG